MELASEENKMRAVSVKEDFIRACSIKTASKIMASITTERKENGTELIITGKNFPETF